MAATIDVSEHGVSVSFTGVDRMLCLSGGLQLRSDEITGVRLMPRAEAVASIGWRVGGAYWPKLLSTGWFTVPGRTGKRQLWNVYRDDEVLVIETTRDRPTRLVLQDPDRAELCRRIGRLVRAADPGPRP